jgi:hypothetical protein
MSEPVIILPDHFDGQTLSNVAADVVSHAQDGWPPSLIFDFSSLEFIRPAGVVFLSNLAYWLLEQGTAVKFQGCDIKQKAVEYLDDSLFFQQHCGKKISAKSAPRGSTRPLMKIAHKDSHAWLETSFVPWLARKALSANGSVVVSFDGIQTATSSFVHAAFVELLDDFSYRDLKARLRVTTSTRQINDMIKTRLERSANVAA